MDDMISEIREYFNGFFDDMQFYQSPGRGQHNLAFAGKRNGNVYDFLLPQNMYAGDMLYHWLENLKGDIIQSDEQIILEK